MSFEVVKVHSDKNGRLFNQDDEDVTKQIHGDVPEPILKLEHEERLLELEASKKKLEELYLNVSDNESGYTSNTSYNIIVKNNASSTTNFVPIKGQVAQFVTYDEMGTSHINTSSDLYYYIKEKWGQEVGKPSIFSYTTS